MQDSTHSEKAPKVVQENAESLEEIFKRISNDFADVTPLQTLAGKLQMEPGKLILIIIIGAFCLTIIGAGSQIVNFVVGMLYPVYMTTQVINIINRKTLKKPERNQNDIKQWLSYWIIFLSAFLLDKISYQLFFQFEALYHPVKTMFLIWLYYPRTRGALIVYDRFLSPNVKALGLL